MDMVKDEEDDLCGLVLEEDPEMYEAAGIPYQPPSTSAKIQQAIQSAITSLPSLQAAKCWSCSSFYVSFLVKYL